MTSAQHRYFEGLDACLDKIRRTQRDVIEDAARRLADAFSGRGILHAFGCGHSGLLVQDLYYRAGGSMLVNPIFAHDLMLHHRPVWLTSHFERLEGYARTLLEGVTIDPEDVLLVVSTSGKNAVPVGMALAARERGLPVIALTSVIYAETGATSTRLHEVADVVLDNGCVAGDAVVSVDGLDQKVGAASTVAGSYILQAMMARVAELLAERGAEVPIFYSGNLSDGSEKNEQLMEKYRERLKRCTGF